jgi:micrococcal nuclease
MNYKNRRNIIIASIIFLLGILVGGRVMIKKEIIFKGDNYYFVKNVIDGDTIELENGKLVRLIGIDAPEKDGCYYDESTKALENLVLDKQIYLEKDTSEKDKFERLLRYVKIQNTDEDNVFVNRQLILGGYALATPYPPDIRYRKLLYEAENVAKDNNLGLWANCDYVSISDEDNELDINPPSEDCDIKGNISRKGFGKVYFLPNCPNYKSVKIDPRKGDKYFCSEQEAIEDGFHKSENCL